MREMTRTITRKAGKFVIELGREGVSMRRFGCSKKGAIGVSIVELARLLGVCQVGNRAEAFDQPIGSWQPNAGQPVWLDPTVTGYSRGVVLAVCPASPEPMFNVRMARGKCRMFYRGQLRPAPPILKADEPLPLEQLPGQPTTSIP